MIGNNSVKKCITGRTELWDIILGRISHISNVHKDILHEVYLMVAV